jgi:hypothetical protein
LVGVTYDRGSPANPFVDTREAQKFDDATLHRKIADLEAFIEESGGQALPSEVLSKLIERLDLLKAEARRRQQV